MNRLLTLIGAGVMAFMLTACGEQAPKQPDVNSDTTTTEQTAAPAADVSDDSAVPAENASENAAPTADSTDAAPATESTDTAPESAGTQE